MKELVIFDIDGTLVVGQSQQSLIHHLYKQGKISNFAFIGLMAWFILYKLHIISDPERALVFALIFLKDWRIVDFDQAIDSFLKEDLSHNFYPKALEEINKHKKAGREILLVSNAVEPLVKKIAAYLGGAEYICTKLESKNGIYTGRPLGKIVYGKNKVKYIFDYIKKRFRGKVSTWGYGDHDSDIPFLENVNHAYVVNPSASLASIASKKHWQVLRFTKNQ